MVITPALRGPGKAGKKDSVMIQLYSNRQTKMKALRALSRENIIFLAITLFSFLLMISSGCSLKEIHKQTSLLNNLGHIQGKINITNNQKGPVIVLRFWDDNGIPVLQSSKTAAENGEYEFAAIPGNHYLAAFIDVNKDGKHQLDEHGNYYGKPSKIAVADQQTVTLEPVTISGSFPTPKLKIKAVDKSLRAWLNIGSVVNMGDPRFNKKNYSLGLWQPFDFLEKAEGGLFFFQEFAKNKIPVLFVHGVANGPTLWAGVIDSLDREHFQPWVFYYPTGLPLDIISEYLMEAVSRLQDEYDFKELYVIAHSMGGVITRSFVKKYVEQKPEQSSVLRLVMTVNSPMGGLQAAASGLRNSPIVVPSWRDIAPESAFLQEIDNWNWPSEIAYYLVISFINGKSGDGVVPLQSQALLKLQSEATRIYVFNSEHTETITDPEFLVTLRKVLDQTRRASQERSSRLSH